MLLSTWLDDDVIDDDDDGDYCNSVYSAGEQP